MTQLILDQAQGQRLKREGQETVAARAGNALLIDRLRWWARCQSEVYGSVTTDAVRLYASGRGEYPSHHNFWGCLFRQKGWVCIGRQPSKLPGNHAREIRVWQWIGLDTPAQKEGDDESRAR